MINDVTPPGETLKEALEERNMSIDDLALTTRETTIYIQDFINAKVPLIDGFTRGLERALDIPADFWLALEHNYRESLKGKQ